MSKEPVAVAGHVHEWGFWSGIHGQRTTLTECGICHVARKKIEPDFLEDDEKPAASPPAPSAPAWPDGVLETLEANAARHLADAKRRAISAEDWRFANGYGLAIKDLEEALAALREPTGGAER